MITTPKCSALLVGIASYENFQALPDAVLHDAHDVRLALSDSTCSGSPPEDLTLLLNEQATYENIGSELLRRAALSADDTFILYFSGHGASKEPLSAGNTFLLPVDAKYDDCTGTFINAFSGPDLATSLSAIKARKIIVVLDCCHAGGLEGFKGKSKVAQVIPDAFLTLLSSGAGRVVIASCKDTEYSYVRPGARNSVFTNHFVNGLRGAARSAAGVIGIFDVFSYAQTNTSREEPTQHPIFKGVVDENIPLALAPLLPPQDSAYQSDFLASIHDLWAQSPGVILVTTIGSTRTGQPHRDLDVFVLLEDDRATDLVLSSLRDAGKRHPNCYITAADIPSHWLPIPTGSQIVHFVLHTIAQLQHVDAFYRASLSRTVSRDLVDGSYIYLAEPSRNRVLHALRTVPAHLYDPDAIISRGFSVSLLEHMMRDGSLEFRDRLDSGDVRRVSLRSGDVASPMAGQILGYVLRNIVARVLAIIESSNAEAKEAAVICEAFRSAYDQPLKDLYRRLDSELERLGLGLKALGVEASSEVMCKYPELAISISAMAPSPDVITLLGGEQPLKTIEWSCLCCSLSRILQQTRLLVGVIDAWRNPHSHREARSFVIADYPSDRHAAAAEVLGGSGALDASRLYLLYLPADTPGESYVSALSSYFHECMFRSIIRPEQKGLGDFMCAVGNRVEMLATKGADIVDEVGRLVDDLRRQGLAECEIADARRRWLGKLAGVLDLIQDEYDPCAETYRHHRFIMLLSSLSVDRAECSFETVRPLIIGYLKRAFLSPILYWLEGLSLSDDIITKGGVTSNANSERGHCEDEIFAHTAQDLLEIIPTRATQLLIKWVEDAVSLRAHNGSAQVARFRAVGFRSGILIRIGVQTPTTDREIGAYCGALQRRLLLSSLQEFWSVVHHSSPKSQAQDRREVCAARVLEALSRVVPMTAGAFFTAESQYANVGAEGGVLLLNPLGRVARSSARLVDYVRWGRDGEAVWEGIPVEGTARKFHRFASLRMLHDRTGYIGRGALDLNTWSLDLSGVRSRGSFLSGREGDFVHLPIIATYPLSPFAGHQLSAMPIAGVFVIELPMRAEDMGTLPDGYNEISYLVGSTWLSLVTEQLPGIVMSVVSPTAVPPVELHDESIASKLQQKI